VEIKREKLSGPDGARRTMSGPGGASQSTSPSAPTPGPVELGDFRVRQLQARDMLRGDLTDEEMQDYVEERVLTTTLDKAVAWARGNSIYPMTFGLACCAIEMASRRSAPPPARPTC
jgi:hypothetical protein